MSNILGVSAGFHDAALSVVSPQGEILFAAHSERYSKIKHDSNIHPRLIEDIQQFDIQTVAYYEKPWRKQLRRLRSGERLQWGNLTIDQCLNQYLGKYYQQLCDSNSWADEFCVDMGVSRVAFDHHLSHAAAGFQTSPFDYATVVVIDAIGEIDTISIYRARYNSQGNAQYTQLWKQTYPHSIGLFYSAMTKHCDLVPMEEEYILMGMSAYGKTDCADLLQSQIVRDIDALTFKDNYHIGLPPLGIWNELPPEDAAACAQQVLERLITSVMSKARTLSNGCENLVFMGGVALNCLANRNLGEYFEHIWIMPNPGDAGSSLGAAALAYGHRLNWRNAYLGHDISGAYPIDSLLDSLLADGIVGVASGRAEFGPRALGNRSLLADPRGADIKDRVNEIKRRQKFRPFAPVVLEEMADQYFDFSPGWCNSHYMQSVARCRFPDRFPAICHVDGTSRVQTVPKNGSGIRMLLEKWHGATGCPMLLNTSLNVRGEPMVNDRADANRFEMLYGVKVCS
jgi:carbamoyltransferase